MSQRLVNCTKYNQQLPGLEAAPFAGDLGQEIYEKVSARAWQQWQGDMMIKVINEYRLNLADAEQYNVLIEQMRAFLGLTDSTVLEVENEQRGRS